MGIFEKEVEDYFFVQISKKVKKLKFKLNE